MKLNTITEGTWTIISNYLNINFNKLNIAINKLGGIGLISFKGTYLSENELKTVQNSPVPGDYGFVLVNEQSDVYFKIYYTDLNYNWVTDDGRYDPSIILGDYIEMIALDNINQIDKDIEDYNKRT